MTAHDLLTHLLAAIAGGMFALGARAAWQHDRDHLWDTDEDGRWP